MHNHRRLSQLLASLFALALIASACGGGSTSDSTNDASTSEDGETATTAPGDSTEPDDGVGADASADGSDAVSEDVVEATRGGVLKVGLQTETDSLNPTNTPQNRGPIMMLTAIFDTLVVVDEDGQWQNNLTESWTPSDDLTTWDVKIREGITFTDGNVMDADAVIRTIEAFLGDPILSLPFKPSFDPDTPIEKLDDLTFRINAIGPNGALPYFFAEQLGMVGSPAWLDARDADPSLDQMPVGSGPFIISERTQDLKTVLVRNDNWWRTDQEIWLDGIEFFPVPQDSSRADQFLVGDLDLMQTADSESILRFRDESGDFTRVEDNSGEEFMLLMNAEKAPFDDLRVRQAATHAFPKQEYLEFITEGIGFEADSLFSSETPWNVPGLEQLDDMPELAQPLIDEYCAEVPESCTEGRVNIEYQYDGPRVSFERIANVVTDAWDPFFNIDVQVIPNDQHILEVITGQYNSATWRYHGFSDPDVDTAFLTCSTIGALSINWSRNCNEEREELILAQRETQDFDERYEIWTELQQNLHDSYQYILIDHVNWLVMASDTVGGLCDATSPDGAALGCQTRGVARFSQIFLAG